MNYSIMLRFVLIGLFAMPASNISGSGQVSPIPVSTVTPAREMVLSSAEANKFLPGTLFFDGQQVFVESRNAEGILFSDRRYFLTALLDTSGHATSQHEGRLACVLTEVPLEVNGHRIEPGVYEVGLDDHHHFVLMDIAAQRLFGADTEQDQRLLRPKPLQIASTLQMHSYRLYLGRDYVSISRTNQLTK